MRGFRHVGRLPEPARTLPLRGYSPGSTRPSAGQARFSSAQAARPRRCAYVNLRTSWDFWRFASGGGTAVSDFNAAGVRLHNSRRPSTTWTGLRVHGHPATAGAAPARGGPCPGSHPHVAARRGRYAGLLRLSGQRGRRAAPDHARSHSLPAGPALRLPAGPAPRLPAAHGSSSPPAGGPHVTGDRPNCDSEVTGR
jgi:hypothetical protein